MSHVVTLELRIKDLASLMAIAEELGLERRNKTEFKWYGRHVGDYPLPEGFSKEEMGKCEFALGVKGNPHAYEIGLVRAKDGEGYVLMYDFYAGGMGLEKCVGQNCQKLVQGYAAEVAAKKLRQKGMAVTRSVTADGKVVLTGRR